MKKILFLFFILPFYGQAQIITTIAGNGTAGYSGDRGLAVSAELNQPNGIAVDSAGNIYFSDWGNNCIRKISTSGIITTIAGNGTPGYSGDGGPASAALLHCPNQIYIDATGNIYFPEALNHIVRKISATGIISTIAGSGTPGFFGDGGSATAAQLNDPIGIAFDGTGNMYIGDFYNNRVRKVNTSGIISTYAGTGAIGFGSDGVPATSTSLYHPNFLLIAPDNDLYISDNDDQRIRRVNTAGIITTFIGNGIGTFAGDDGPATASSIYFPGGFAFDVSGNFYLADYSNTRIRRVNTSDTISTFAGTGVFGYNGDGIPASTAELNYVVDVVFDNSGNLLVSDFANNRIRIIKNCEHTITASPVNDTVLEGTTAVYSVTTSMASPAYQWQEDPGTGFVNLADIWPYSGVTTNVLTIHNASIFLNTTNYRCVISNGTSCTDTSTEAILIIKNNTAVNNISAYNEITVYPNPATSSLTVLSTGQPINQVAITNLIGETVYTNQYNQGKVQVDVADLPTGLYFIKVNGSVVKKFTRE